MKSSQNAVIQPPAMRSAPMLSFWCFSPAKRAFDLLVATMLLLCVAPLLVLIAILVKLSSPGPVLFHQVRVGREGRLFSILKFRTMFVRAESVASLACKDDSRITPIGRLLRRLKFDELPQLFNVLAGEMTLVGPRPDLPEFTARLPLELRTVLLLKPGVTSPASLQYRNEESYLSGGQDTDITETYVKRLLPDKVQLDLHYAQQASFVSDLHLILRTAVALFR